MSKTLNCGKHGLMTPELIEQYASQGMTLTEIGLLFECTSKNVGHAINHNAEKKAAWTRGNAKLIQTLTSALMRKVAKDDIIAILFALKCKGGWIEAEKLINKPDETIRPVVNVYLPDNHRTDNSTGEVDF